MLGITFRRYTFLKVHAIQLSHFCESICIGHFFNVTVHYFHFNILHIKRYISSNTRHLFERNYRKPIKTQHSKMHVESNLGVLFQKHFEAAKNTKLDALDCRTKIENLGLFIRGYFHFC